MRTTALFLTLATAAGLAATASGCGGDDNTGGGTALPVTPAQAADVAMVNAAADDTMYSAAATDPFLFAAALMATSVVPATQTAQAASNAATNVNKFYGPAGCATATSSGATVTYVLNDCKGPISGASEKGSVAVTFTPQQSTEAEPVSFQLQATGTAVQVGLLNVTINRQGILTRRDTTRTLRITSDTSTATGPNGNVAVRESQGTLTWTIGATCATHNGADSVTFGNTGLTAKYTNVIRCNGSCPQSGTVAVVDTNGAGVTLTYNGSASVPFNTTAGTSGTIGIACGGK